MVTPPRYQPNSKMLQGGETGNKRFQHHNQIKRSQSNKSSVTNNQQQTLQASSSAPQKSRQNHHPNRSKQMNNPQQHPNRISPTHNHPVNTNNHHNNKHQQQQHQRHSTNRQTPPRQIVNQVNMNNGQPSLVELTAVSNLPASKNVVKSSQKPLQDNAFRNKKGQTMPPNGSRSSPVSSKSNRASPQGFAGSKCFEPPTPNSLPKPPSNWTPFQFPSKQNLFGNLDILTFGEMTGSNNHAEMHLDNHSTARDVSQELQLILKANA